MNDNISYRVLGLMSGTSLDGVDASLIQSDGESKLNIMENLYIPYTKSLKFGIKELKRKINKILIGWNLRNRIFIKEICSNFSF